MMDLVELLIVLCSLILTPAIGILCVYKSIDLVNHRRDIDKTKSDLQIAEARLRVAIYDNDLKEQKKQGK